MADTKPILPCPNCGGEVSINESYGGRGTMELTAYIATCKCGFRLNHLGDAGTRRSAISGFKKFCRDDWPTITPQLKDEITNPNHWKRHDIRYR